ncbi:sulfatase [Haloferax volcanii]|uniref:Sulfatase n=1 Tax=Haloferax volcanii TaxID=2246 RepID=A0A6C0UVC8_HALVO|nr:sulfatase [Haloferax alexandrinus]QIB79137.1 sulfatase [Haloferax alexandrinus]
MKNVVLITVDCLRSDRCGFNDHHRDTTPNLDQLATNSLIYDRCYSTGPYTTESFPGMMAGQHSYNGTQYGDNVGYKALSSDSSTLATELTANGYETAAVISNPHLTTNRNFDGGFDTFTNHRSDADDDHDDDSGSNFGSKMYALREKMRNQPTRYNPLSLLYAVHRYRQLMTEWPTTDGADIVDEVTDTLQQLGEKQSPFFLWTHFMDVHAPISPKRADEAGLASVPTFRSLHWDASRAGRFFEPNYDTLYDSAVRYVDNQIGRVVETLRQMGELEETVIIVTGDHGEVLFDRNEVYGHPPHYHYDDLLQVPLLVYDADGPSGRIQTPVSLAWLHEIIAESANVELSGFPSESGLESIRSEGEPNPVISDTLDETGHTISIRDGAHKVILHNSFQDNQIKWEYRSEPSCFNYQQDRAERVKIGDIPESLLKEGERRLKEEGRLPEIQGEFSAQTEQRLQDLGYKM